MVVVWYMVLIICLFFIILFFLISIFINPTLPYSSYSETDDYDTDCSRSFIIIMSAPLNKNHKHKIQIISLKGFVNVE